MKAEEEDTNLKEENTKLRKKIKRLEMRKNDDTNQQTLKSKNLTQLELFDQKTINKLKTVRTIGRGRQSEVFEVR